MNFLAHLHLSGDDPDILTGNMMGDFVKGRLEGRFPPLVTLGLELHRRIDSLQAGIPPSRPADTGSNPASASIAGCWWTSFMITSSQSAGTTIQGSPSRHSSPGQRPWCGAVPLTCQSALNGSSPPFSANGFPPTPSLKGSVGFSAAWRHGSGGRTPWLTAPGSFSAAATDYGRTFSCSTRRLWPLPRDSSVTLIVSAYSRWRAGTRTASAGRHPTPLPWEGTRR